MRSLVIFIALVSYISAERIRRESGATVQEFLAETKSQDFGTKNHPQPYEDNTDCSWLIRGPPGQKVRVNFESIHTERCCDYITIYDGNSEDSPILATLRGNLPAAASFVSTFQDFYISFHSDDSVSAPGFNASFSLVSSEDFELEADDEAKNLTSQNFPDDYPNDSSRCWTIIAPEGQQVRLFFHHFSTELCCDHLALYDMTETPTFVSLLKGTYRRRMRPYFSKSGSFLLCFSSDEKGPMSGFRATYRATSLLPPPRRTLPNLLGPCGGNLTVPEDGHAEFRSPTIWRYYPNGLECSWIVRAPKPEQKIRLWFPYIHTEECCDWIIVRDGENSDSPKMATVSGSPFAFHPYTSSGDVIRVDFRSDHVNVGRGFRAIYELQKEIIQPQECGENLTAVASPQYFSSSNWPNGPYGNNESCVWIIRAPAGRKVAVTLLGVLTEPQFDSIKILNGAEPMSRRIVELRGRFYIRYSALGDVLRVEFNTDASGRAGGFRAVYRSVADRQELINILGYRVQSK
uniref:Deleted in malignant brain tumors 1 protein-like n=1 Tax=Phallusia mammillata TaxID=59560 RepID=A0A6F9DBM2_9ASCI|nr:deleted in malignant brain tumors 1 protein-like [Phallusia mammillata]